MQAENPPMTTDLIFFAGLHQEMLIAPPMLVVAVESAKRTLVNQ
jgi:hypothetical protein